MSYKQRKQAWNNKLDKAIKETEELIRIGESIGPSYNDIINTVIDDWYDSYDSRKTDYEPSGNLKHAYRIITNKGFVGTELDTTLGGSSHHQDNSIIYNNAFLQGYHGGSASKKYGKSKPYYRTGKGFIRWGTPAIKTFSPRDRLKLELAKECKKKQNEVDRQIAYIRSIIL